MSCGLTDTPTLTMRLTIEFEILSHTPATLKVRYVHADYIYPMTVERQVVFGRDLKCFALLNEWVRGSWADSIHVLGNDEASAKMQSRTGAPDKLNLFQQVHLISPALQLCSSNIPVF